jgi:type II secretory pathway predicted ATPase ExeA
MTQINLNSQAKVFFKFNRDPFELDILPSKEELFTNPQLDSVADAVKQAVVKRKFIGVVGDIGIGKTLMKRRVARELNNSRHTVKLIYPEFFNTRELTVAGIVSEILLELGQSVPRERIQRYRAVKIALLQQLLNDTPVALILDEAHALNDTVIASLKSFWELYDGAFARLLGIVLFGQNSFINKLQQVKFSEITQRLQVIEMPDFRASAQDYLIHRIQLAGGTANQIFDPTALAVLCQNAVSPLQLGNLANRALNEAAHVGSKVNLRLPLFKKLNLKGVAKQTKISLVREGK